MEENKAAETVDAQKVNGADIDRRLVLKLRKPVQANGEEVMEIKFREPTGGDIERIGNPVIIDWNEGARVDYKAREMTQMMALLANVPPSTIRMMHPTDWNTGALKLSNFFMPDPDQP
jgi:tail assembly chaperone E/41/14-like protein